MERRFSRLARPAGLAGLLLAAAPVVAAPAPSALEAAIAVQTGGILPVVATGAVAVAPPAPVRTMSRTAPDVFGSVALPVRTTRLDARWQRVSAAAVGANESAVLARFRHLAPHAQAAAVNRWVNAHVAFRADRADEWATAAETLRRRAGDCEDFAIAKLQLLRALGVSANDLYLVVAYDLVRRQDHAMLVMRSGESLLLLNSDSDQVADASLPSDFRPILSFSARGTWAHGYAQTPSILYAQADAPKAGAS